jgi:hypothetical protein
MSTTTSWNPRPVRSNRGVCPDDRLVHIPGHRHQHQDSRLTDLPTDLAPAFLHPRMECGLAASLLLRDREWWQRTHGWTRVAATVLPHGPGHACVLRSAPEKSTEPAMQQLWTIYIYHTTTSSSASTSHPASARQAASPSIVYICVPMETVQSLRAQSPSIPSCFSTWIGRPAREKSHEFDDAKEKKNEMARC